MYLGIVLCILTSVNVPTVLCQDCSTLVKRLTQNQNIVALSWPARSSDRVLIEHAWDILGRNVRCPHDGRTRPELIATLRCEWAAIPQDDIRNIVGLMCRRCTACMRADGGYTSN